ncbi:Cytochrome oxidase assembly [Myotisia sp. PD_48]|nr:Cytochrome oxidase assembly [Myotisia sp. PD_48]
MAIFQAKRFRPATGGAAATLGDKIGTAYRANLSKHPFLLFGLPFISLIVAGSFLLTPATALRYERHDRKVQQLNKEEAMNLGIKGPDGELETVKRNPRRRIIGSEKDEYYKLMAKDLDNWEQKRVKRFKGEPDGTLS